MTGQPPVRGNVTLETARFHPPGTPLPVCPTTSPRCEGDGVPSETLLGSATAARAGPMRHSEPVGSSGRKLLDLPEPGSGGLAGGKHANRGGDPAWVSDTQPGEGAMGGWFYSRGPGTWFRAPTRLVTRLIRVAEPDRSPPDANGNGRGDPWPARKNCVGRVSRPNARWLLGRSPRTLVVTANQHGRAAARGATVTRPADVIFVARTANVLRARSEPW